MKLTALRDAAKWERRLAVIQKRVLQEFREPCISKPVFVLGKQRSGTGMLMRIFHRHSDLLVFDENRNNAAFEDFRLRDDDTIRLLVEQARFPAVCLKPVCDSQRIADLFDAFPYGHFVWMYRDYRDVANSSLRKFGSATRAVRLACLGQPGGGWFQEGLSPAVASTLQQVYRPSLSEFDLACLAWWARNRIVLESGLLGHPNLTLLKYEELASNPDSVLPWLFHRIGIRYQPGLARDVNARSIGHPAPEMDRSVQNLCSSVLQRLDHAYAAERPPVRHS